MIKRIRVQNYRCLRDVDVELEPLTVLVGPNGSGKSTLMRVPTIQLLTSSDAWMHDSSLHVKLTVEVDQLQLQELHLYEGRPGGTGISIATQFVHFDLDALRTPNELSEERVVAGNGANLPNVFATMPRRRREEVAKLFSALVPHFSDVDAIPHSSGMHRLRFEDRWKKGVWYEAQEVSDGTMLLFAFTLIRFQDPKPKLIAIEEPERGLHPFLMGRLIELLRGLTEGRFGGERIQVIMATHSAELLDHIQPNEVRFFTRKREDGSVLVERAPLAASNWQSAYREYQDSLGSMWLSGGLGGVPGS